MLNLLVWERRKEQKEKRDVEVVGTSRTDREIDLVDPQAQSNARFRSGGSPAARRLMYLLLKTILLTPSWVDIQKLDGVTQRWR